MASLILGGIILSAFSVMFYLEDREGGGIYDPGSIHPPEKKRQGR